MTQLEDDRTAGLVASALLHVIMDRVANQGLPYDRRTATRRQWRVTSRRVRYYGLVQPLIEPKECPTTTALPATPNLRPVRIARSREATNECVCVTASRDSTLTPFERTVSGWPVSPV